ncbi:MAG: hypothetical protein HKO95_06480 [Rhodobacteraceae bacterium]|nr:hypothetical protein [Paracoccaceae bacterium]
MRTAALIVFLVGSSALSAAEPRFDPLSPEELDRIVELLVDSGRTNAGTRIARVTRLPVAKDATPKRQARVIAIINGRTEDILVDLDTETTRFAPVATGQAPITSNDWSRANELIRDDPRWRAAMAARGIGDFDAVFCESLSSGYFPDTPSARRRVVRLPCYEISDATTNIYGRPIEGLVATVDPASGEVIDILDEGVTPIPAPAAQIPAAVAAEQTRDLRIAIDGNRVRLGPWSVHAALDDQFGLVLSDVRFFDGSDSREILHEGHVSEIFVPYMDATESWAFRTYLDAGEFGLGTLASPLVPGVDCPITAAYIQSHHLTATARIVARPRTICAFAEPLRGPIWRHYEALNGINAGATGEALVIRSIASIAHYDYIFDWVFGPTGEIEIRIGATGIDAVKALAGNTNTPEGNRVTPDLVAVFHDHFFALRLDLDIDGRRNTLVRESFAVNEARENKLQRSYWRLSPRAVEVEGPLVPSGPGLWRIVSDEREGMFDGGTGYQIMPEGTVSLLHPDDFPQTRAAFSAAPLWVTRQDALERAAAGDLPNQHPGGAGLPVFADGQTVIGEDLVLWPTVGFRHVTRIEDWPVLSVIWKSVRLRPYGFFSGNPSVQMK